jgi:LPS-assembly protein
MPWRPLLGALALALALALAGGVAAAQTGAPAAAAATTASPATLLADRIEIRRDRRLVASGNVEVLYEGRRLRAAQVEYDRVEERLYLTGPLVLTDDSGSVVLADAAELSSDLRAGLLTGARLVLDRQLQMAAVEIARIGGRYTRLDRAVASSCRVCSRRETPLWEIRARRVVHDQQERQIYFDSAQLRFAGLPVFWLPRLRMPDPTLTRATGFLVPRLVSSSALGVGLEVPYFIALGQSRDLTLRPFYGTNDVLSLGFRYRQAFRTGQITLEGAVSSDPLVPRTRGFLRVEGGFALPAEFRLRLSGEAVSDRTYLSDYGLSDRDRLDSRITVERTRRDERIAARLVYFSSLRPAEDNTTLPSIVADAGWTRRLTMPGLGGRLQLDLAAHGHLRSSDANAVGRDMTRATARANWQRGWVLPAGVLASATAEVAVDLHRVAQDAAWPARVTTITPTAAVELRWPLARATARGGRDVLEPIAQLVWSQPAPPGNVPNEDSLVVEFDEGNLFALNRFPGADRREAGTRLNLGLHWTRFAASGWRMGALAGRIMRLDGGPSPFTAASGLGGSASHWLAAVHLHSPDGLSLVGRTLFDDGFGLARAEARLVVDRRRWGIGSGFVWAEADPAESRTTQTSEWMLDGRLHLMDNWTAKAAGRYDFAADRATSAAFGLEFRNECLRVDLSLSRRFTSSTSVGPTTDIGLAVDFLGFGTGRAGDTASRTCRR